MQQWLKEFMGTYLGPVAISGIVIFLYTSFTPQTQMDKEVSGLREELKEGKESILTEMHIRREARDREIEVLKLMIHDGNSIILQRLDKFEERLHEENAAFKENERLEYNGG